MNRYKYINGIKYIVSRPEKDLSKHHTYLQELIKSMESFRGIDTSQSVVYELKHPDISMRIWFKADTIPSLYPISRGIDRRYGGFDNWQCVVNNIDVLDGISFCLEARTEDFSTLIDQISKVTSNLKSIWDNEAAIEAFGIKRA